MFIVTWEREGRIPQVFEAELDWQARDKVLELVDGSFGYSVEFSSQPEAHRRMYDEPMENLGVPMELDDGSTITVRRVVIPDGYVAFGWYTGGRSLNPRTANMGVRESVVHLAPVAQTRPGASGQLRRPYEAVCGRRVRARAAEVEFPDLLARELADGRRKACARCFELVAG